MQIVHLKYSFHLLICQLSPMEPQGEQPSLLQGFSYVHAPQVDPSYQDPHQYLHQQETQDPFLASPFASAGMDLASLLFHNSTMGSLGQLVPQEGSIDISAVANAVDGEGISRGGGGGGKGKGDGRASKNACRPRYAFHTRTDNDILDDGYRWRKYGQKAVKNSIHPRSYYRCTHHACNVKKQVQRFSKDRGIIVTTYEGMHNHPCEKLMETLSPLLKQIQFLSQF